VPVGSTFDLGPPLPGSGAGTGGRAGAARLSGRCEQCAASQARQNFPRKKVARFELHEELGKVSLGARFFQKALTSLPLFNLQFCA